MNELTPDYARSEFPVGERPQNAFTPALRVLGYLFVILVTYVFSFVAAALILQMFVSDPDMLILLALGALITAAASVAITVAFVRDVDSRPVESLGLSRTGVWARETAVGTVIAFAAIGLLFLVTWALSGIRVTGSVFTSPAPKVLAALLGSLAAMIGVAVSEEVIMRGYVLQTLRNGYGTFVAVAASSLLFGLLHIFNPGAGLWAWIGTSAAGLLLAYAYLATGRLWLPIGIHFGWNFALGPVFGFPVSGLEIPSWIEHTALGAAWWTGGRFGPEAGVWVLPAMALMAAGVWLFTRKRDFTAEDAEGEIQQGWTG